MKFWRNPPSSRLKASTADDCVVTEPDTVNTPAAIKDTDTNKQQQFWKTTCM